MVWCSVKEKHRDNFTFIFTFNMTRPDTFAVGLMKKMLVVYEYLHDCSVPPLVYRDCEDKKRMNFLMTFCDTRNFAV
jgi:hypothetical protein